MRNIWQEGDSFRGATLFAKGLHHTIVSAWGHPKNTKIKIILRRDNSQDPYNGSPLEEVKTEEPSKDNFSGRLYACSFVSTVLI